MICRDLENSEAQLILTAVRNDFVILSQHEVCEFHTHALSVVLPSPCLTNTHSVTHTHKGTLRARVEMLAEAQVTHARIANSFELRLAEKGIDDRLLREKTSC